MLKLVKNITIKKYIYIILALFFNLNIVSADDRVDQLNMLFNELKINNPIIANEVEQKIWKIWSTHPNDEKLTSLLAEGSNLVNNDKYSEAIDVFSKAIELDPLWAEAWNKRATVLYLSGEFEKSQNDIDKVLELEKRHFGALAGQGLVNIHLKNYEKAIESYEKAKEIYPSMKSPEIMIKQIKKLIKEQSI
ncbi:tetratricopeptide repeat protein [Candidatus Pelagibacter sp. HIMB1483]|uniref:tetratricopeptide repeat protein n=1 Tax=Candidatus Pelagibacter sp. HIMB1483 TaxID=3415414 RepID=UPI003F8306ED